VHVSSVFLQSENERQANQHPRLISDTSNTEIDCQKHRRRRIPATGAVTAVRVEVIVEHRDNLTLDDLTTGVTMDGEQTSEIH